MLCGAVVLTFGIFILNGTAVCGLLDAIILLHVQAATCTPEGMVKKIRPGTLFNSPFPQSTKLARKSQA